MKNKATKANNNIKVAIINLIILISSVYNNSPILFINVIFHSFLSTISNIKEVVKELSLNKKKVRNMIKGIKKYNLISDALENSFSGVSIITKPNIIVNAEQYIIINKYDRYSTLFSPNNIATVTIKPIKLKMIFIGFLSMINSKPNKIINNFIASILCFSPSF